MSDKSYDVLVIGGGASGMMAAGRAAERSKKVLLLEKNKKLGEKLRITGGGRCNITNAEFDTRKLLKFYGKAEQFLFSPFSQFGVKETFSFFESRGLPLIVEENNRAFPKSQKAEDVAKVMEAYVKKGDVMVLTDSVVTKIHMSDGKITNVSVGGEMYKAKEYIFATGSMSHKETGSTGDGFAWLKDLGHTVVNPTPTIVPLKTKEAWSKEPAGVSLADMKIYFYVDGKKFLVKSGPLLFTHFGLSGPLILNSAHAIANELHAGIVTATIDIFPKLDLGALEKQIISIFDVNKNKVFKNIVKEFVPDGMSKGILALVSESIDVTKQVNAISKEERKILVNILKALPLTVTGLMGFDKAVIVDGGISLNEIDTKTMRSKKISNLFVTGDLLHINRPSGGFSLQLCWSTGYVAGSHASE